MKKIYFIAALAIFSLSSCQKKEKVETNVDTETVTVEDTTSTVNPEVTEDTTTTATIQKTDATEETSDVKLQNTMSTKTTTTSTNPAKGKFALAETKWKLVQLNGKAVANTTKKDFYINLDSKSGKFAAYAGCNKIMGVFVMKASDMLAFSNIAGTKMACPNMDFETGFIKTLEKVDNYMIEGNELHFHKGKKAALAKFEAIK